MPFNITSEYLAGGASTNDGDYLGNSVSEAVGRFRNNLSGTTANNLFNSAEAEKVRAFNSAEAAKDREWQEMMSNTAFQRQVADMTAAGFNPASLNGDGASTPQGSRAGSSSAASASPVHSRSGIAQIAAQALKVALFKKFSHSAMAAKDAGKSLQDVLIDVANSSEVINEKKAYSARQRREMNETIRFLNSL